MWLEAMTAADDMRAAFRVFIPNVIAEIGIEATKLKPYCMNIAQEVLTGGIIDQKVEAEGSSTYLKHGN